MARQTSRARPRTSTRGIVGRAPGRFAARRWVVLGAVLVVAAVGVALYLMAGRTGHGVAPEGAIAVLKTGDFHALAFSPSDPNVVFFGHHNGILRSDDRGRTWRPLVERPGFDAMALVVSPAGGQHIYLAGHDVFQISADGGASWRPVQHNLPGTDIHAFAMSRDHPDQLYAFVVGHGVFQSTDAGRTWQRLPRQPPSAVTALAIGGGSSETLYVGTAGSGVVWSSDGGQSWVAPTNELSARGIAALAVDPSESRTLYAGINGGLYRSADGGAAWARLPFPGENAIALAVSPSQPNVILAITFKDRQGLVYRSEDAGQTWGRGS